MKPFLTAHYLPNQFSGNTKLFAYEAMRNFLCGKFKNRRDVVFGQFAICMFASAIVCAMNKLIQNVFVMGVPSKIAGGVIESVAIVVASLKTFGRGSNKSLKNQPMNGKTRVVVVDAKVNVLAPVFVNVRLQNAPFEHSHPSGARHNRSSNGADLPEARRFVETLKTWNWLPNFHDLCSLNKKTVYHFDGVNIKC